MHLLVNLARAQVMFSDQRVIKNCFNCAEWLSDHRTPHCNFDDFPGLISPLTKTSLPYRPQNDCNCAYWHEIGSPRRIQIGPS